MIRLWRSVVGKLWMTIIGLVTLVLVILTFLQVQFFDRFYYEQHNATLKNLAHKVALIFETYEDKEQAVRSASELVEVSRINLLVVSPYLEDIWQASINPDLAKIDIGMIYSDPDLLDVFHGQTVVKRDHFPVMEDDQKLRAIDVIIVGAPLYHNEQLAGAVYLYQKLDLIQQTTKASQQLILQAAGIGIILTTIFAFFLSTRITSPLRQIKLAADNMAEGDFKLRVPIRSNDEIGDLARTFNHLAQYLNESIRALSHEKEQLSNILKSMVDGVLTLDVNGRIILINPPAEAMLNTMKYEEGLSDESSTIPKLILEIFYKAVQSEKEEVAFLSAQGRFWTIVMAPLYDQQKIRGVVAVLRDTTEERRLDKLRKDFVANVSHELRTPLVMLQGYSEALIDDIIDDPTERKEIAQIIYDESLRMGRLVNGLLDLARMESGHIELNLEEIRIEPIIDKITRKFSSLAREKNIELVKDVVPTEHLYVVDADRLEQIFTNLIDNALRHTPEQGKVTVCLKENKDFLHVGVIDTGSGIAEEELPFVFERFYKEDKARTRGSSGTGIGLAIVKNLVQAHGGTIQVHSKLGEGTAFTIKIPRELS